MNTIGKLVAAALAAGGLAAAGPAAAQHHGGHHWSGGGHWRGGHFDHHFHRGFGWSFAFGVPLFWPGYAWGYPYYYPAYSYPAYGYAYPAYPDSTWSAPAQDLGPAPDVTPGPGAPTEGPLYMNYCASAKAYYPKVTQCPEGWKFIEPTR
ncbi:MAG TPA: hypothetical protein VFJ86_08920 [Usitatibacter sp.]|jgi:hypothetical protein|nr:hypothetical protein [Usitatibacter sp.]